MRKLFFEQETGNVFCGDTCQEQYSLLGFETNYIEKAHAYHLIHRGYTVIPVFDTTQLRIQHTRFGNTLKQMPEFNDDIRWSPKNKDIENERWFTKGQFGALGNPSSFHNQFVREIRQIATKTTAKLFSDVIQTDRGNPNRKLEQIVDRMSVRRSRSRPGKDSWHQDTTPPEFLTVGDSMYGGWVNFDLEITQHLSCFAGSHKRNPLTGAAPVRLKKGNYGFEKFSEEEQAKLDIMKKNRTNGYINVDIPPGHMLIFIQELVHEVAPKRGNTPKTQLNPLGESWRLYLGWRLTMSRDRFMGDIPFFKNQSVPKLKSGQMIDTWPSTGNWYGSGTQGLQRWAIKTWKPVLLETKTKSATAKSDPNVTYIVPPQHFYSLHEVSLKLQAENIYINGPIPLRQPTLLSITINKILENIRTSTPAEWYKTIPKSISADDITTWNNTGVGVPFDINNLDHLQMLGLTKYGHNSFMYPEYTEIEKAIMSPNNTWVFDDEIIEL